MSPGAHYPGGIQPLFNGRVVSIIDDDSSVRDGLSSLLRSHGIRADSFASAGDFLKSRRLHDSECLIVDVKMPEMGGLELLDELSRRAVFIPVIFISARATRAVMHRVEAGDAAGFVEKPFAPQAIEHALRSALGMLPVDPGEPL
jgi:FixJ family two-component response regulator